MFALQGAVCFALWIGYGIVQSRRSDAIRKRLQAMPRKTRALAGALLMIIGGAVLFGSLLASHALNGFTPNGMTLPTWIAIALAGLVFVHAQTMSMAMLITLITDPGVTSRSAHSSDHQAPESAQL